MRNTKFVHYLNISPYIRYVHEIELPTHFKIRDRIIYDNEYIFGISGKADVICYGNTYRINPGDLLLIKPHEVHSMNILGDAPFRCICVHFDWAYMGQAFDFSPYTVYLNDQTHDIGLEKKLAQRPADQFTDFELPVFMKTTETLQFLAAFREVVSHFQNTHIGSKLMIKTSFLKIIALVSQELTTNEGIRKDHPHADKVLLSIRYLQENYAQSITTAELAAICGFSSKYFGSIFKKATGVSVTDYLLRIRLEHAKSLLSTTMHTIEEIADMVGIRDIYYFSKLFKKKEGMPPRQYRNSTRLFD